MKKIIFKTILLFVTLLFVKNANSQNRQISGMAGSDPLFPSIASNPASPTFDVNDIYFLNKDTAVAVGAGGMAWQSTDGGLNWSVISTFTSTVNNNSVYMEDKYICIAGDLGLVTFSNNRGLSWQNAAQAQSSINYHAVDFADTTFGIAVGDAGDAVIYKWAGSFGWLHIPTGLNKKLNAVASFKTNTNIFADGNAIAVGNNGAMATYSNGNWSILSNTITTNINGIYLFPNNTTAIAVGDSGLIMRSSNFGSTWSILNYGTHEALRDISEGITPNHFIAVGDSGVIYVSADTGHTFTRYTVGFTTSDLKGVSAKNPRGSFGGSGNTLRLFTSDTITAVNTTVNYPGFTISPNPVSNILTVYVPANPIVKTMQLYNSHYSKVYSESIKAGKNYYDLSDLSPGVYFLIVEGKAGKIIIEK